MKKEVINIQAAAYNGARTVYDYWIRMYLGTIFIIAIFDKFNF